MEKVRVPGRAILGKERLIRLFLEGKGGPGSQQEPRRAVVRASRACGHPSGQQLCSQSRWSAMTVFFFLTKVVSNGLGSELFYFPSWLPGIIQVSDSPPFPSFNTQLIIINLVPWSTYIHFQMCPVSTNKHTDVFLKEMMTAYFCLENIRHLLELAEGNSPLGMEGGLRNRKLGITDA